MEGSVPKFRRRQYIVSTKFQLQYVGLILLLVFLTGALCSYVVYYTSMLVLGDKLANVYPQGRLVSIVTMVNSRIIFSLLLAAPIVIIIGIYASHKIAGPIYRIERFLNGMASGDLTSRLSLRKGDALIPLVDGINHLSDSVKAIITGQKECTGNIAVSLNKLKELAGSKSVNNGMLNNAIDKLSDEIKNAEKELDKYKV